MGEGGWVLAGGGGGKARGDLLATGESRLGGSGELARMKFVMWVRSGLLRGASTLKRRKLIVMQEIPTRKTRKDKLKENERA